MLTVSVGMTTYNSSLYVKEQLESIVNQTRLPDEIIIYDDASTDNTVEIIQDFSKNGGGYTHKIIYK